MYFEETQMKDLPVVFFEILLLELVNVLFYFVVLMLARVVVMLMLPNVKKVIN
ncbi:MAG: hypothetical protein U5L96_18745 [Owenweeksia sp.]|nr:hypothetical protein [Owenweeksia sp.]